MGRAETFLYALRPAQLGDTALKNPCESRRQLLEAALSYGAVEAGLTLSGGQWDRLCNLVEQRAADIGLLNGPVKRVARPAPNEDDSYE